MNKKSYLEKCIILFENKCQWSELHSKIRFKMQRKAAAHFHSDQLHAARRQNVSFGIMGDPIDGCSETLWTSQHYGSEGFKEGPKLSPLCREAGASQTADGEICGQDLTHLCPPLRSTFAVRETASLGIMGELLVPPLNPSETIVLSENYCLWGV